MFERKKIKIKKRISDQKKQKKILLISFSVVALLCCFSFYLFFTTDLIFPKITLKVQHKKIGSTITINYKQKYQSPKLQATYHHQDISKKVSIEGEVNVNEIGDYKITYIVNEGAFQKKRTLVVKVRDLKKPTITLAGGKTSAVCPGEEYREIGYQAYDNLDGNITKKVKVKPVGNRIIYSVKDSSGNYQEIVRNLVYEDKEEPELILSGLSHETLFLGETWEDPGYEVKDNCSKNLKEKVKVHGDVDTKKKGEYEIIYHVRDDAGNENFQKRIVQVIEHGQNGTIYLTFDDGPKYGTTDVILDILKEEGIKATFFVTNNGPDELIVREDQEGHTVGLHTASHNYSYLYSSVENYYQDLYSVFDRVKRLTGKESYIIRFPGGSSNTISRKYQPGIMSILSKDVLNKGFRYYDWNLVSGDAGDFYTADEIYHQVTTHLSKDRVNIVLMHDVKTYTRDALKNIIQYAKENGYVFDQITKETEMLTQKVNN